MARSKLKEIQQLIHAVYPDLSRYLMDEVFRGVTQFLNVNARTLPSTLNRQSPLHRSVNSSTTNSDRMRNAGLHMQSRQSSQIS